VGEQSERAAAGEALTEDDGGREIPSPGFAGWRSGQALGAGGRGDEKLLLARSDNSGRLIDDGQWRLKQLLVQSRAARQAAEWGRGKVKWAMAPSDDVRSSDKEWPTHVGGDDRRPSAPSALCMVSAATGNRGGTRD
jgi:hypothetical protein